MWLFAQHDVVIEHFTSVGISVFHFTFPKYEGHLESKERFVIQRYLLVIGKKKNMQVLSHTFAYFST